MTSAALLYNVSMKRHYVGDCRDEQVVEDIFGSVSSFACAVEEYGDSFTYGNFVVEYDENSDIHTFYVVA